jgi:hypothetical protein
MFLLKLPEPVTKKGVEKFGNFTTDTSNLRLKGIRIMRQEQGLLACRHRILQAFYIQWLLFIPCIQ